jgi:uncharacterized protein (TIGR00266 family)
MQYEIRNGPASAVLEVALERGEEIRATQGAMMTRSPDVSMEANVGGEDGIGGMVKRAVSDGPSPVETTFTAERDDAMVTFAPDYPGDVTAVDVTEDDPLRVRSGSILAWDAGVTQSVGIEEPAGGQSSGELRTIELSGRGMAFLSSFGAVSERVVTPEDPLVADEDHLVAWRDGLDRTSERVGAVRTDTLGGEGNVTTFTGNGRVWLQARNPVLFGPSADSGVRDLESTGETDQNSDPPEYL